jgi:hypothetical protein
LERILCGPLRNLCDLCGLILQSQNIEPEEEFNAKIAKTTQRIAKDAVHFLNGSPKKLQLPLRILSAH